MATGWLADALVLRDEAVSMGKRSHIRDIDELIGKAVRAGLTEAELLEARREAAWLRGPAGSGAAPASECPYYPGRGCPGCREVCATGGIRR